MGRRTSMIANTFSQEGFTRFKEREPDNLKKIVFEKAEENNQEALQCLFPTEAVNYQPVKAIALFHKAIYLSNDEATYYFHQAESFLETCEFLSAIAFYKVAIQNIKIQLEQKLLLISESDDIVIEKSKLGPSTQPNTSTKPSIPNTADFSFRLKSGKANNRSLQHQEFDFGALGREGKRKPLYLELRLAQVYYLYGQVLIDQKRYSESIKILNKGITEKESKKSHLFSL